MQTDLQYTNPVFSTAYNDVVFGDSSRSMFISGRLAPATGGVVYDNGQIMAQYTSGPMTGLYVNYDSVAGTNGQQTPVGVLADQDFNISDANANVNLTYQTTMLVAGYLYYTKLKGTQNADIAAYLTAFQATNRIWTNLNGDQFVHIP